MNRNLETKFMLTAFSNFVVDSIGESMKSTWSRWWANSGWYTIYNFFQDYNPEYAWFCIHANILIVVCSATILFFPAVEGVLSASQGPIEFKQKKLIDHPKLEFNKLNLIWRINPKKLSLQMYERQQGYQSLSCSAQILGWTGASGPHLTCPILIVI